MEARPMTAKLGPCRECGKNTSPNAQACPHCGAPFPAREDWKGYGFEWKSKATFCGYPLVHIAFGRDTQGRTRVAKGIIAIGQFAIGLVTIAQFGVGFLFGFGQFVAGATCVGQIAIGVLFGAGQFATGYIAIGQFTLGYYALAQMGFAKYLWSPGRRDIEAVEFFRNIYESIIQLFSK